MINGLKASVFIFIISLFLSLSESAADIYKYEDDEGVLHFTDAPNDRRFKIFMRDIKKDRLLRTNFRLSGCVGNPAEFEPIINSCALEYGVDKSLVKAVIHAESGYNPNAVSPKGASGLMQLMPKPPRALTLPIRSTRKIISAEGSGTLDSCWTHSRVMFPWRSRHTMRAFPGLPNTEAYRRSWRPAIMLTRSCNTGNRISNLPICR